MYGNIPLSSTPKDLARLFKEPGSNKNESLKFISNSLDSGDLIDILIIY